VIWCYTPLLAGGERIAQPLLCIWCVCVLYMLQLRARCNGGGIRRLVTHGFVIISKDHCCVSSAQTLRAVCECVCVHACDAKGIRRCTGPDNPFCTCIYTPGNIHGRPTLIPPPPSLVVLVHRDRTRLSVNHCHLFIRTHTHTHTHTHRLYIFVYYKLLYSARARDNRLSVIHQWNTVYYIDR